ncbi:MAG: urea ABC transporter permease subunit UrtB [Spirochaetota bacterium]
MNELVFVQILNSISSAMIIMLGAIGLSIIFGLMGVINMAHGEFFMLGAYFTLMFQNFGFNLWVGIIAAPLLVGIVGLILEYFIIKRFYTRPLVTLPATWGISIIIKQIVKLIFGVGNQNIINPMHGRFVIFGIEYPRSRVYLILITVAILFFLFILFKRTVFGLKCRAIMQNREMAEALGINVIRVDHWTFALGSVLAGFAGAVMTPIITINPLMGETFLAQSFLVVILGGVGNLFGIVGGAFAISILRFALSYFIRLTTAQILVLVMAIIVIRFRPQGLFGRKSR